MVSQTVVDGLRPYNIGEKIRGLRLRKKMGLVELGQHSGLSAALLSKLERGKLFPTLPTLLRIALVFSVGLEYFFREDAKNTVSLIRKKERQRFPDKPATINHLKAPSCGTGTDSTQIRVFTVRHTTLLVPTVLFSTCSARYISRSSLGIAK